MESDTGVLREKLWTTYFVDTTNPESEGSAFNTSSVHVVPNK